MTKWYDRIGNTIEMCVCNKWIKGIIVNGPRTGDGIINMEDLTGKKYWCGSSGEGIHFRKCDDSDGDLISNADRIRQMTDEELAVIIMCPYENMSGECQKGTRINCIQCCLEWLRKEAEEKNE